jgi:hypothetical protein
MARNQHAEKSAGYKATQQELDKLEEETLSALASEIPGADAFVDQPEDGGTDEEPEAPDQAESEIQEEDANGEIPEDEAPTNKSEPELSHREQKRSKRLAQELEDTKKRLAELEAKVTPPAKTPEQQQADRERFNWQPQPKQQNPAQPAMPSLERDELTQEDIQKMIKEGSRAEAETLLAEQNRRQNLAQDAAYGEEKYDMLRPVNPDGTANPTYHDRITQLVKATFQAARQTNPDIRLKTIVEDIMDTVNGLQEQTVANTKSVVKRQAGGQALGPSATPSASKSQRTEGLDFGSANSLKELEAMEAALPHADE